MKTKLLPSYATLPLQTILSNVTPQDRDRPKETTTWWALVAQRDLQYLILQPSLNLPYH